MVKFFKNGFLYLALIMLTLVSFNIESAQAAEAVDYEEGVTNLNNTPENSAVVGSQLLKPEIGWKRYDTKTSEKKFIASPNPAEEFNAPGFYNVTTRFYHDTVTFNFHGSKFRLLATYYYTRSTSIEVSIDGKVVDNFSENISDLNLNMTQRLVYEKDNLPLGTHIVTIKNIDTPRYFELDAIDIDGQLLAPGEVPNVQSITLDKNNLELLEGSQDKITATVTPDTAKVIWTSSDESIAIVDQNGNVTAIREGQAIITATIENTDISATSTVIVKKPISESPNAILSITLVNGITKEYDVTNAVLNNYLNWFDSAQGTSTFKFSKTISPYKKVTEYVVHNKIASFEVREY
ncbi:Ig-like domain-containing protein [Lysinibacillus sp. NPDC047702]|uniref:Ig-like domain-containing protein n=1 Tax=unclassified Lysinibacillus TaxID=2636778 RepID=UPI003CFEC120